MKTNFQFFLNSYADFLPTATPSQNNFKWLREINGIPFNFEFSQQIQVPTSVTTPNLMPYPFGDATNSGSYSTNSTTTLTVSGSTDGIEVGSFVVGSPIPPGTTVASIGTSQYTFTVSAANATAGAVYSNNGVSLTVSSTITAGTTLVATGTGDPTASGTLTLVSGTGDATIAFSAFTESTPIVLSRAATSTGTSAISFYSPASFIYLESDQQVSVIYNGGSPIILNPFEINGLTQPAVFFMAGPVYSLTIENLSTTTANTFLASMG